MPRQIHKLTIRRAEGWTAYERSYGRQGRSVTKTTIRADGEPAPMAYSSERPATAAEIETEQARRAQAAERSGRMEAFRARPEWSLADDIRSSIEIMEYDKHPLDRMTLAEWQALRDKICG